MLQTDACTGTEPIGGASELGAMRNTASCRHLPFIEDLDRAAQHHFAHLRAEILKGAPADRMKRQIPPRAVRAPLARHSETYLRDRITGRAVNLGLEISDFCKQVRGAHAIAFPID